MNDFVKKSVCIEIEKNLAATPGFVANVKAVAERLLQQS